MLLPTDNQTEGVILTDAPLASASDAAVESHGRLVSPMLGSPLTVPASPAVTTPHLISFRKVLRERALWLSCVLALLLVVLAYQPFPDYINSFDAYTSNGITSYAYSTTLMHLGAGWGEPRPINPQDKGHPNSNGSYSMPISPLYTTGSGDLQLDNFGYPLGSGTYKLELDVIANVPMSFTISVGGQVIGTYAMQDLAPVSSFSIPASAFLASGPDPTITFAITHSALATSVSGVPSLNILILNLYAPSPPVLLIPPLFLLLWALLFILPCYFVVRKIRNAALRVNRLVLTSLVPLCYLLLFTLRLDHRHDISANLLGPLLLALLVVIIAWRRELANWVLHLRYPDDERFRLA